MSVTMTGREWRAALSLASLFAVRMLGLFMVLPVLALYAEGLAGATAFLAGLALGVYGLSQALLQIPFGYLSDRLGRKPMIVAGLLLFALGSAVAALSDHIWGVIAGRALQGAGAIASVILALAADLTREENRSKAMAAIGGSIGASFALALVLGPALNQWIGVKGLFWVTCAMAVAGLGVVGWAVPPVDTDWTAPVTGSPLAEIRGVLQDRDLLRLDVGIFTLHLILTAGFMAVPHVLQDQLGLALGQHWVVYLGVLLASFLLMVPMLVVAEKRRRLKPLFLGAVAGLAVALLALAVTFRWSAAAFVLSLVVFFTAFNILEATLPSLVSRVVSPRRKGSAMGVYSSSQFLGAFVGGVAGGALYPYGGASAVLLFGAVLAAGWLWVARGMRYPGRVEERRLPVAAANQDDAADLARRLRDVRGVTRAEVRPADGTAYLTVDASLLDEAALRQFAAPSAAAPMSEASWPMAK